MTRGGRFRAGLRDFPGFSRVLRPVVRPPRTPLTPGPESAGAAAGPRGTPQRREPRRQRRRGAALAAAFPDRSRMGQLPGDGSPAGVPGLAPAGAGSRLDGGRIRLLRGKATNRPGSPAGTAEPWAGWPTARPGYFWAAPPRAGAARLPGAPISRGAGPAIRGAAPGYRRIEGPTAPGPGWPGRCFGRRWPPKVRGPDGWPGASSPAAVPASVPEPPTRAFGTYWTCPNRSAPGLAIPHGPSHRRMQGTAVPPNPGWAPASAPACRPWPGSSAQVDGRWSRSAPGPAPLPLRRPPDAAGGPEKVRTRVLDHLAPRPLRLRAAPPRLQRARRLPARGAGVGGGGRMVDRNRTRDREGRRGTMRMWGCAASADGAIAWRCAFWRERSF